MPNNNYLSINSLQTSHQDYKSVLNDLQTTFQGEFENIKPTKLNF